MDTDELLLKHRQERKELQSKIQSLKKGITKGDKKRKKEVTEEINKLEEELNMKHKSDLENINNTNTIIPTEEILNSNSNEIITRVSRAQKRRNKKAQAEKDREDRILEQTEKNRDGPRVIEMNTIKEKLKKLDLQIFNIPADGNCLYCAINHQLEIKGKEVYSVAKLRKLTAEYMREYKTDFMPFMYGDSEESISEEYFESYCKEVEKTKLWGGQLELKALSNILTCPIKIIQASGPPTLQGENFNEPELVLTYHRHLYRLGEHYNSTIELNNDDDDEEDNEDGDDEEK